MGAVLLVELGAVQLFEILFVQLYEIGVARDGSATVVCGGKCSVSPAT